MCATFGGKGSACPISTCSATYARRRWRGSDLGKTGAAGELRCSYHLRTWMNIYASNGVAWWVFWDSYSYLLTRRSGGPLRLHGLGLSENREIQVPQNLFHKLFLGIPHPHSSKKVPINMDPKVNRFRDIHCGVKIREMLWSTFQPHSTPIPEWPFPWKVDRA
jgi:hypothetical protein